ncbi:MAG: hypothetical protein IJ043_04845 [Clostridia bacterium]|nr:hypothetical protein [Clostridia bacterium]
MKKAQPIWIKGLERRMNTNALFRTEVPAGATLHLAGTAFYRVYLNSSFIAAGPARTAKGYLRKDLLPLPEAGELLIEACGYYCKSVSTTKQPSCILAEVEQKGEIIAYTGRDFTAAIGQRLQKTERYSIQRHFTEVWDHRSPAQPAEITVLSERFTLLDRRAPYPRYDVVSLPAALWRGRFAFDAERPYRATRWTYNVIPENWGVFPETEISHFPYRWIQRQAQHITQRVAALPLTLQEGEYAVFDFGQIEAGFLTAALAVQEEADLVIGFSEYFEGQEFRYAGLSGHHVVEYLLAPGEKELQTFEPYTCRFAMVAVKKGSLTLRGFGCRRYEFPLPSLPELGENEAQKRICRAAVRTFAHNAVDLYTDCPSRERGGWLCDSYFTARTEYALTGQTLVEDAFLENYRLFKNEGALPEGMLPDAYPADVRPINYFIPQWAMWYILEVEEYILKRDRAEKVDAFRPSIYALLDFYRRYENADGLLESLPGWNFVEWSEANNWTQDVNYPTNFLYARVLEAIYNLYGDEECKARAAEIRKTAVAQSFNGRYFMDHAIRDETGILQLQEHSSEAGQYYAVLFGGIDIQTPKFSYLKDLILNVFTPERDTMPEIFPVNAFIGAYLRMDALLKMGEHGTVLKDIEGFFGHMGQLTGTLWEYREFKGSFDHGFASYVYTVIKKSLYKE